MSLEELILRFGIPLVFFGTMVEGDGVLVVAGLLAHRHFMPLPLVILAGALGTWIADEILFFIGDRNGEAFIAKRPDWQKRASRVLPWIEKYGSWLVIAFRYLYGLRSVVAFMFGMSKFSPVRFAILNLMGALIWATLIATAGFYFGSAVETFLGRVKSIEYWAMGALAVIFIGAWLFNRIRKRQERT